ncbi:hypothetical protein MAUB1S_00922 [Mycolicibacterium aubagnense]
MADSEWRGVVVEKSRGLLDGSNLYRRIAVRLDDGSTKKIRVSRELWSSLAVGDHIVKQSGGAPTKINAERRANPE